ncbi:MAG: UUP1 family membrane protein, partial [Henriciella sp.]|nr:UUP1 family membrane protein [Henriciella sp.]
MKRTQLLIIVGALIAAALGIFSYKVTRLGFPVVPNLDSDTWTIEAKVSFRGRGDPVTLRLALPNSEGQFTVVDETFVASGFGVETDTTDTGRQAVFERRAQDGSAVLFYSAKLIAVDQRYSSDARPTPEAVSDYRRSERRRAIEENATPLLVALDSILTEALEKSAGERSFITQLARLSADESDDRISTIIEGGPPEISNASDRLVFLLNAAGTPARHVQGIILDTDTRQAPLTTWVEYWLGETWVSANGTTAEPLNDARTLPIVYDRQPIVAGDGFNRVGVSWSVARNFESQLSRAMERGSEFAPWVNATSLLS